MDLYHATCARRALQSSVDHVIPELWLECALLGPTLRFESAMSIAIGGAEMNPKLNGDSVPHNCPLEVNRGDILAMSGASRGVFAYIAFSRRLAMTCELGSVATLVAAGLGGREGRALVDGDELFFAANDGEPTEPIEPTDAPDLVALSESRLEPYSFELPRSGDSVTLPVRRGPEFEQARHGRALRNVAKDQQTYLCVEASVGSNSSRMATILTPPSDGDGQVDPVKEASQTAVEMKSSGVFPGVVQLNHAGELMVLMRDGPTTGGYPRVAVMEEPATWRLAQCPPNSKITLELVG